MARKLYSYGLLLVTILWLVASYLPESMLLLPKFSLEGVVSSPAQQIIFIAIMALFVAIQISLIFSTNRLFKKDLDVGKSDAGKSSVFQAQMVDTHEKVEKFGLKRGPELFWTAVPVAMTLVVILFTLPIFS